MVVIYLLYRCFIVIVNLYILAFRVLGTFGDQAFEGLLVRIFYSKGFRSIHGSPEHAHTLACES